MSRARLHLIAAMLIFGTIGLFRKFIPLPSGFVAAARGLIGSVCLYVFMRARKGASFGAVVRRYLPLLIVSGIAIGFNWVCLFEAYKYTSIATATLCYYMAPTIVILASPFFTKERLSPLRLLCVLCSLLGIAFVSGVFEGSAPTADGALGILLGLAAAVLYAFIILVNKKLASVNAQDRTVIQLFSAFLVMTPYSLITETVTRDMFTVSGVVLLLIVGVVHTALAYALYFSAIGHLPAQTTAFYSYIDPVSAVLLSAALAAFFGQDVPPTAGTFIGAVLIIGSAILSELPLQKKPG